MVAIRNERNRNAISTFLSPTLLIVPDCFAGGRLAMTVGALFSFKIGFDSRKKLLS